jgi:hypothetical protein
LRFDVGRLLEQEGLEAHGVGIPRLIEQVLPERKSPDRHRKLHECLGASGRAFTALKTHQAAMRAEIDAIKRKIDPGRINIWPAVPQVAAQKQVAGRPARQANSAAASKLDGTDQWRLH